MIVSTVFQKNLIKSSSLALGVFDGVHLAHQKILRDIVKKAKKYASTPAVITFSNHPHNVLSQNKLKNITSVEQKLNLLKSFGIETVILLEFTKEMAALSAEDYLKLIVESLNPKSITLGFNHSFGAQKRGDGAFLAANSSFYGYETAVIEPVTIEEHVVSSSLIRRLISDGKIELASRLLGRDFSVCSQIIEGAQKGRTIGFPTINLKLAAGLISPNNGVYAGYVKIGSETFKAAINVGHAPTFNYSEQTVVEAHLFDFERDVYFENAEVFFTKKIRNEQKFSSITELKENISRDCALILQEKIEI